MIGVVILGWEIIDVGHGDHAMSQEFVIPPKKTADGLLRDYWIGAHPLQPFLHNGTFMERFVVLSLIPPCSSLVICATELMYRLRL